MSVVGPIDRHGRAHRRGQAPMHGRDVVGRGGDLPRGGAGPSEHRAPVLSPAPRLPRVCYAAWSDAVVIRLFDAAGRMELCRYFWIASRFFLPGPLDCANVGAKVVLRDPKHRLLSVLILALFLSRWNSVDRHG